jgi:hypothetical protein
MPTNRLTPTNVRMKAIDSVQDDRHATMAEAIYDELAAKLKVELENYRQETTRLLQDQFSAYREELLTTIGRKVGEEFGHWSQSWEANLVGLRKEDHAHLTNLCEQIQGQLLNFVKALPAPQVHIASPIVNVPALDQPTIHVNVPDPATPHIQFNVPPEAIRLQFAPGESVLNPLPK